MKKILVMLMMILCSPVYAEESVNLENMTPGEKAQVLQTVDQIQKRKKEENKTSSVTIVEEAEKYVSLGENIGKAFGGAAKEVGVAVNDFANTPVGMMTMALIVWNYVGQTVLSVVIGLTVLVLGILFIKWWYKSTMSTRIIYNTEKTNWFGNHPVKSVEIDEPDSDSKNTAILVFGILMLVVLIIVN